MTPSNVRRLATEVPTLGNDLLTIIVGTSDAAKTFYIHGEVAKAHSDFFAAALNKGWKEAENRIVRLPEEVPEEFELFNRFVYFGKVYTAKAKTENEDYEARKTRLAAECRLMCRCWILGDKLMSNNFKDAVIDALVQVMKEEAVFVAGMHKTVYPKTGGSSGLRRLCVDNAVWFLTPDEIAHDEMDASWMEFYRDLAIRLHEVGEEQRNATLPFWKGDCEYHEHVAAGKPCYRSLFP